MLDKNITAIRRACLLEHFFCMVGTIRCTNEYTNKPENKATKKPAFSTNSNAKAASRYDAKIGIGMVDGDFMKLQKNYLSQQAKHRAEH